MYVIDELSYVPAFTIILCIYAEMFNSEILIGFSSLLFKRSNNVCVCIYIVLLS